MDSLSKAQKNYLLKHSHQVKPIFQLGKQGLTDSFYEQVDLALNKREMVKLSVLANSGEDPAQVAEALAGRLNAQIIQVMGRSVCLYRPSRDKKYQDLSLSLAERS